MIINPKDYLLAKLPSEKTSRSKYGLFKVKSVSDTSVIARFENNPHIKTQVVEVPIKSLVLNLGPSPVEGKFLGVSTKNLYKKSIQHPDTGRVDFFVVPDKKDLTDLSRGLVDLHKSLKKHRLSFLLEEDTTLEIIDGRGLKYAGLFMSSRDRDKVPSRIRLCISSSHREKVGADQMLYVLAHEFGHALHYHHVKPNKELNSKWISLFKQTRSTRTIERNDLERFLKLLLKEGSVKAATSELEAEDVPNFKLTLRWISVIHGLSKKDLDDLLESENSQDVKDVWPRVQIGDRDLKPLVSQYALKNYHELLAESFAYYLTGKKLPSSVLSLVEKTLSSVSK